MTEHTRIRKFNTRDTYPEQKLDNDLCQAVVARGTMVFLRGQVSQDLDTRESLHVGDATLQTRKTMENIKLLMEEAGGNMDHICRIVVYLTDVPLPISRAAPSRCTAVLKRLTRLSTQRQCGQRGAH